MDKNTGFHPYGQFVEAAFPESDRDIVPLTFKDGSTTYHYRGNEYLTQEEAIAARDGPSWGKKAVEFAGKTLMSSPTINYVVNKAGPVVGKVLGNETVQDALSLPGEETIAGAVGDSFVQYGYPRIIGETGTYLAYPGPENPTKFDDVGRIFDATSDGMKLVDIDGTVLRNSDGAINQDAFAIKGGPELPPFSKKLNEQAAANQQLRIDEASKALKKKNLKDRKQFASVLKRRIRAYVEEFKGSDADINEILSETNRIYKNESIRHINARKSVRWLNSYFKKLGQEVSEDGLSMRQLRIADVNGKPRLVHDNASGKGIKIYKSAFEKDHVKAKTIFERLAKQSDNPELFAGADFSDNLDVVLTVFNRAKKDFDVQGVSIPDEVLRATGSSTSLRELVRRNLDPKFDAQFQRIPERFRNVAKNQMIEDIVYAKSKSLTQLGIKRIVNKHLKWWDEFGETMVQLDDYVPSDVLKQLNEVARQNPQDALLELQKTPIWSKLNKSLKTRWQNLSDRFVNLEGGLRRRPKGKFYDENY